MRMLETWETVSRWPSGHYNPRENIVVKRPHCRTSTIEIEAKYGTRDSVYVYRESDQLYVLNVNRGMPYVGLARYDLSRAALGKLEEGKALEASGEVFLQIDYEITETLGPRGVDYEPRTLVARLAEYTYHD